MRPVRVAGEAQLLRSRFIDSRFRARGTRFLIYPQYRKLPGFSQPSTVYVDSPPGTIESGPRDDRMYVVDAIDKEFYRQFDGPDTGTPPWRGPRMPGADPDADGHFDHAEPGTNAFTSAAVFATVRSVLAIWEGYFGRQIPWYFANDHARIEIVPLIEDDNAWSGYGFLEFGRKGQRDKWYAENFDVVAHETGHLILRHVIGNPPDSKKTLAYRGHDEAAADLIAIVSSLHLEKTVTRLLAHTRGNLFSPNELSRMGEVGRAQEVRKAFNALTMKYVRQHPDPNPKTYKYLYSRPFTGGAFDVLVEIYAQGLIERRAITRELAEEAWKARGPRLRDVQRQFADAYRRRRGAFADALLDARDYFGRLLARAWEKTSFRRLSYPRVLQHLLAADTELSNGRYRDTIRDAFAWRGIRP